MKEYKPNLKVAYDANQHRRNLTLQRKPKRSLNVYMCPYLSLCMHALDASSTLSYMITKLYIPFHPKHVVDIVGSINKDKCFCKKLALCQFISVYFCFWLIKFFDVTPFYHAFKTFGPGSLYTCTTNQNRKEFST